MALISNVEFKALRDIGNKVDESKLTEVIDLAQKGELYDLLGNFLFDVIANVGDAADYDDLLDGSTFTKSGDTYTHAGLKAVLADLAYSRYLVVLNPNFTPFGLTYKDSEDLERVDKETLNRLVLNAQKDADAKMRIIRIFMGENMDTFSRFYDDGNPDLGFNKKRWSVIN